jgi:O-antigen/teichoic acid export membrane protein
VLIRFSMRLVILVIFAAFGGIGFGRSLAALLGMTALLSAVVGILKRETPFDVALNHWDETLAYAALFCLANGLNQLVPG